MQTGLVGQGLELMLFGMGTVVVFLSLLVLATLAMSALVRRWVPAPDGATGAADGTTVTATGAIPHTGAPAPGDALLPAVIAAAINMYRNRHRAGSSSNSVPNIPNVPNTTNTANTTNTTNTTPNNATDSHPAGRKQ